jgi:hypothetical protein
MFGERTSVGLDVHARSVVAAAVDGQTGELLKGAVDAVACRCAAVGRQAAGSVRGCLRVRADRVRPCPGLDGGGVAVRGGGVVEAAASGRGSGEDRCGNRLR